MDLVTQVGVLLKMSANLLLELLNWLVNKSNVLLQLGTNHLSCSGVQAVHLLLARGLQIFEMAQQRPQFVPSRFRWCPNGRLKRLAESGHHLGIQAVGFAAAHLTGGKAFDASGIDHAHSVAVIVQKLSHIHAVNPGRLHADMSAAGALLFQPAMQLSKPGWRILHLIMATPFRFQQIHIQRFLGNIHTQIHDLPFRRLMVAVHLVPCKLISRWSGFRYRSTSPISRTRYGLNLSNKLSGFRGCKAAIPQDDCPLILTPLISLSKIQGGWG